MVEMSPLLLALLAQEVYDIHIPEQEYLLLLLGHFATSHELRVDSLGTELHGA